MVSAETSNIIVYIGLGSNLDNPLIQLKNARLTICDIDSVQERAFSSFYRSPPMGPADQPDYINAVMALTTMLPPMELLRCLQRIEYQQGRVRGGQRWTARTLDLDLLLYGDRQINMPDLIVPHSGIAERAFVLYPLNEIAPQLQIPGLGAVAELIAKCPSNGLVKLEST